MVSWILVLMTNQPGITLDTVCHETPLSKRQIRRYISYLKDYGVVLSYQDGGYSILDYGIFDRHGLSRLVG